jgi:8-oxo-dGTP diphosphatase
VSGRRILRVAELLRLDDDVVAQLAAALPARVSLVSTPLPVGALITLETRRRWWDLRARTRDLRLLEGRMAAFAARERVHVVAAALIRDRAVLAARRNHPPELAGWWEFPGGKVEKGETLAAALARECQEELGIAVLVGPELSRTILDDGAPLVLFEVSLAPGSPEPRAIEHQSVAWTDSAGLASLAWLPANRGFLASVTSRLTSRL